MIIASQTVLRDPPEWLQPCGSSSFPLLFTFWTLLSAGSVYLSVRLSVCLSTVHVCSCCKNHCLNKDATSSEGDLRAIGRVDMNMIWKRVSEQRPAV